MILRNFDIHVKNLLKSEFPKCEFVVHIYTHKDSGFVTRGYHIVTKNTNIYEIRNFARKYPYFDGVVGNPFLNYSQHDLEESIVVPDYIMLKKEYNNHESICNLVTLWKMKGLL